MRAPLDALAEIPELYRVNGSFANHEAYALHRELLARRGDRIDPRVARRIVPFAERTAVNIESVTALVRCAQSHGMATLLRHRQHIRITMLINLMGARGKALADSLSLLVIAIFSGVIMKSLPLAR